MVPQPLSKPLQTSSGGKMGKKEGFGAFGGETEILKIAVKIMVTVMTRNSAWLLSTPLHTFKL